MKIPSVVKKKWVAIPVCIWLILYVLNLLGSINHNQPTEIGIARNVISGEVWIQEGGWHIEPPWVWVAVVDLRPIKVAVTSAGRGYSAKLVEFNKAEWKSFIDIEGWYFWWWANRFSINFGYDEEYRGMKDIMRGYAYSPQKYPFITVIKEFDTR